jgi:hypothetical protein
MNTDRQLQGIHAIVDGETPLSDLYLLGLDIRMTEHKDTAHLRREWTFGPGLLIQVHVTRRTIARGLLRVKDHGWDVEAWAAFILAAPFVVVVDAIDEDALIQVLWNVSAGEPLTDDDLALINQYVSDDYAGEGRSVSS